MFIEIPANLTAVFSNDGRVFYDLGDLVSQFENTVEQHETIAPLMGEDRVQQAKGQREFIDALKSSLDLLALEASLDRMGETD